MAKKKKEKLNFETMEPLAHNPFSELAGKFGVKPSDGGAQAQDALEKAVQTQQPSLMVRMEKRKKGKVVTCIYHLADGHGPLLKTLKKKLGTGGAVNEDHLELQGDHRDKLSGVLKDMGYQVRAGN